LGLLSSGANLVPEGAWKSRHPRARHLADQVDKALCLTLATDAAVLWTAIYLGDALDAPRHT
jgi:hypothetical protein